MSKKDLVKVLNKSKENEFVSRDEEKSDNGIFNE